MTDIQLTSLYGPKPLGNVPILILTGGIGKMLVSMIEVVNAADHPITLMVWKNGHDNGHLIFGPTQIRGPGGRAEWAGTLVLNLSETIWMQAGENNALTVSISGAIDS